MRLIRSIAKGNPSVTTGHPRIRFIKVLVTYRLMLDFNPFPYQGSKRKIAKSILRYFPKEEKLNLVEPFAGSAALSIAAAYFNKTKSIWLNDSNESLIKLWKEIIWNPSILSKKYAYLWNQQSEKRQHYNFVRDEFNRTNEPHYFLYLLARCVKGSIRYNTNGQFNQSPDNRRKGMLPEKMKSNLLIISRLMKNQIKLTSLDYKKVLPLCDSNCLVYMDPPYQGVCTNRDSRYQQGIKFSEFVNELEKLNEKGVPYIVSYDGRTGSKKHGKLLPNHLNLTRVEINAGPSSQASLLGRKEITIESLYISEALISRIRHIYSKQKELLVYA